MKKQVSTLSLIAFVLFAIWQYFTESKPSTKSHTKTTQSTQSAVNSDVDFGDYDVIMRDDPIGQNAKAPVDYYMLALSWSPGFCGEQREKYGNRLPKSTQYQCETNRAFGWVVHGLWPQNAKAKSVADHPRFCQGDLPKIDKAVIQRYLTISPGAVLLQGEWEKHGSCAFDSAEQYFAKEQALFNDLNLPTQQMPRNELFRWMKQHNPALKNAYLGASRNELFICYDKRWQVIDCSK